MAANLTQRRLSFLNNSIVFRIEALPEAKIRLVKRMPKFMSVESRSLSKLTSTGSLFFAASYLHASLKSSPSYFIGNNNSLRSAMPNEVAQSSH